VVPGLAVATGRSSVVGLNPSSGRQLWSIARREGPPVQPAIDLASGEHGLIAYVEGNGPATSAVVAIDPSTRAQRWRATLGDLALGAPAIDGGRVYVGSRDDFVYAFDESSGNLTWKVRTQGIVDSAPAVADGRVFVVSSVATSGKSRLYAVDAVTGHIDWTYGAPGLGTGNSSVTVAVGLVFVGLGDATLAAVDAASGTVEWRQPVRGDFSSLSSPALAGGSVYALDRDGGVYRFDAQTGRRIWIYQFLRTLAESGAPLLLGKFLYVGLDDGTVGVLSTSSGHLVFQTRLRGAVGAFAPAQDLLLVPSIGPAGTLVAFRHDPRGALTNLSSPSDLRVGIALANYAGAFVIVLALVLAFFTMLRRRREEGPEVLPVPGAARQLGVAREQEEPEETEAREETLERSETEEPEERGP